MPALSTRTQHFMRRALAQQGAAAQARQGDLMPRLQSGRTVGRMLRKSRNTKSERRPMRLRNQLVPAGGGKRFPRGKYHVPGEEPRQGYSPRELAWQISRAC